jgi:hypothetical protein
LIASSASAGAGAEAARDRGRNGIRERRSHAPEPTVGRAQLDHRCQGTQSPRSSTATSITFVCVATNNLGHGGRRPRAHAFVELVDIDHRREKVATGESRGADAPRKAERIDHAHRDESHRRIGTVGAFVRRIDEP